MVGALVAVPKHAQAPATVFLAESKRAELAQFVALRLSNFLDVGLRVDVRWLDVWWPRWMLAHHWRSLNIHTLALGDGVLI